MSEFNITAIKYPHGYKVPEGKFEVAMTHIVSVMEKSEISSGVIDGIDLSDMNAIAKLQEAYEALKAMNGRFAHVKYRKHFYTMLSDITGYYVDGKKKNKKKKADASIKCEKEKTRHD